MSDKEDEIDLKDMENHIKDEAKKLQDQRSAAILEQLKKARNAYKSSPPKQYPFTKVFKPREATATSKITTIVVRDVNGVTSEQHCVSLELEHVEPLPRMKAYIEINKNVRCPDDNVLPFIPYFADSAEADTKKLIRKYSGGERTIVDPEVPDSILVQIVEATREKYPEDDVFMAVANAMRLKSSSVQLQEQFEAITKDEVKKGPPTFCVRCMVYGCLLHLDPQPITKNVQTSQPCKVENTETCDHMCYKLPRATTSDSVWTADEISNFNFLSVVLPGKFCLISQSIGTKTCKQVFDYAEENPSARNVRENSPTSSTGSGESSSKSNGKRAQPASLKNVKPKGELAMYYTPCHHPEETCDAAHCSCYAGYNTCEKYCQCSKDPCGNRYYGCQCKGECKTIQCDCFGLNQECNREFCKCCLDDENSEDANKKLCKNFGLSRGVAKKVELAKSTVAGWGLFAAEDIKTNDFIIEYCGELITQEEADRRAFSYEQQKCNYLFDVSKDMVIDATRQGNLSRFINHSDKPNCKTRNVKVNGDSRIAFIAIQDIKKDEELFFDYGYDQEKKKLYGIN